MEYENKTKIFQSILNIIKIIFGKLFPKDETEWKKSGYKLSELDIIERGKYYIIYNPDGIVLDIVYKKRNSDINFLNEN